MSGPHWEVEGRGWPHAAHSRFVEAGGLRWHVQTLGEGPPLLLIHGTGAATHSWRSLGPLLAERFTVIAPDLPGHGFTQGRLSGGQTLPGMARAVGALLDTLAVAPCEIIGHSAGAAIAVRMTLDGLAVPARIVGLNPALMPFPGLAGRLFPGLAKLLFNNAFTPQLFARRAKVPGEVGRFMYRNTGSRLDAEGVALYTRLLATPAHCAGALSMMADWDLDALRRDLPGLTTPLLLIHGEGDTAIPLRSVRDAAALLPNARLVSLPRLGHLAHEENAAAVAAVMLGEG